MTSFLAGIFSLSRLSPDEIWLLQQFACLPSEFHSYQLLHDLINPEAGGRGEVFAETLHELNRKGWLLGNADADAYKMHLVVAEVVKKEHLPDLQSISALLEQVTGLLRIDQTKDNPIDKFPWIPFGKVLLEVAEKQTAAALPDDANRVAILQNNLALRLQDLGDYAGAKTLLEKALRSDEQNFGSEHPKTAVRYSNLAAVYFYLNDLNTALDLTAKAYHIYLKHLGAQHPETKIVKENLDFFQHQIQ